MKRLAGLLSLGLILVLAVGCAKRGSEEAPPSAGEVALRAAYASLEVIRTATRETITYADYETWVGEASAALMAYRNEELDDETAREAAALLSEALYDYQTAQRAWKTKSDECPECAWRKFVNGNPRFAMPDADADYAVALLWNEAAALVTSAGEKLSLWKNVKS
ncbi:MAG: hypothetical protein AB1778_01560 [Candidatus Bipolaricaulota bacterium]